MFLSLSLSLPLPPSISPLLSPAGIPLTSSGGTVFIRQFELAQVVCDGSETRVSDCTINKVPTGTNIDAPQALVRCFQQTGTYIQGVSLEFHTDVSLRLQDGI